MTLPVDWTPEMIANAIRDEIALYEKLREQLPGSKDAEHIRTQMKDRRSEIFMFKKELSDKARLDLWSEFIPWEKSLA